VIKSINITRNVLFMCVLVSSTMLRN